MGQWEFLNGAWLIVSVVRISWFLWLLFLVTLHIHDFLQFSMWNEHSISAPEGVGLYELLLKTFPYSSLKVFNPLYKEVPLYMKSVLCDLPVTSQCGVRRPHWSSSLVISTWKSSQALRFYFLDTFTNINGQIVFDKI